MRILRHLATAGALLAVIAAPALVVTQSQAEAGSQSTVAVAVGARFKAPDSTRAADWKSLTTSLGVAPETTLDYITGDQWPSTWHLFATPAPTRYVRLSFKSLNGSWKQFLTSVPAEMRGRLLLVWHHEHERPTEPWGSVNSAAYRAQFTAMRDALKAHAPWAKVGMSSSGTFYRPTNGGYNLHGEWFPQDADFYSLDTYQTGKTPTGPGSIRTLDQAVEFQSWNNQRLELERRRGEKVEWHITEYGRGVADGALPGTPQRRLDALSADLIYLKTIGCKSLTYFLAEGPESTPADLRDWIPRPEDWPAFVTAFGAHIQDK